MGRTSFKQGDTIESQKVLGDTTLSDDTKPIIAIDGRLGLRWPFDARGEYVHRLITELGFLFRSYELHIYGDVSAHPGVFNKIRFIHSVDLLVTPNDIIWEQVSFPYAARKAALIHGAGGGIPLTTRIPRVLTVFDEKPKATMIRNAKTVFTFSQTLSNRLVQAGMTSERVITLPLAPTVAIPNPVIYPKEPYLLLVLDHMDSEPLVHALTLLKGLKNPEIVLKVIVRSPKAARWVGNLALKQGLVSKQVEAFVPERPATVDMLFQHASAVLVLSGGLRSILTALNAWAVGAPLVAASTLDLVDLESAAFMTREGDVETTLHAVKKLLTDESRKQEVVGHGQERVKDLHWKSAAAITRESYLKMLN